MKTTITLEIETTDMKKFVPDEYICRADECPEDEICTDDVEQSLHNCASELISDMFTKEDTRSRELFEEQIFEHWDEQPEGPESLADICKFKIKVVEIKVVE